MRERTRLWIALLSILAGIALGFVPRRPFSAHQSSSSLLLLQAAAEKCDVAVFGGGFGGLYTALAISREANRPLLLDIVLVEPTENFVFLPLLYDLTVGTATEAEVCPAYKDLLQGTGIRHVRATLTGLDAASLPRLGAATLSPKRLDCPDTLQFRAGVIAVGASPESILKKVPGAVDYVQPFYTEADAKKTRRLLNKLSEDVVTKGARPPRIAVVGGGYGGVELAACVKRRLPKASVSLLSRGAPMAGTRAEPLVDAALQKLGVVTEECSVTAIEPADDGKVFVRRCTMESKEPIVDIVPWDTVLWTAGSAPADPVSSSSSGNSMTGLQFSGSGRLALDPTLRCLSDVDSSSSSSQPRVWALGDCAEIVNQQPALPKTAQCAMQQAETVASNLLAALDGRNTGKNFTYQDLGSMFTLGGPNAAVLAPKDGTFAPILEPVLDIAGSALGVADQFVSSTVGRSKTIKDLGLTPDQLGLSLGSHGLGVESGKAPGTLAGAVTGAARRAVYAVRMPTNQQRVTSLVSAALSTAAALAKEASDKRSQK